MDPRPSIHFALIFSALAVGAFGCGGASIAPTESVNALASIHAAETVRAEDQPQAALHLALAREQVAAAETAVENGDENKAKRLLMRAQADADLATALAQEARTTNEAEQIRTHVSDLQQQLPRPN